MEGEREVERAREVEKEIGVVRERKREVKRERKILYLERHTKYPFDTSKLPTAFRGQIFAIEVKKEVVRSPDKATRNFCSR